MWLEGEEFERFGKQGWHAAWREDTHVWLFCIREDIGVYRIQYQMTRTDGEWLGLNLPGGSIRYGSMLAMRDAARELYKDPLLYLTINMVL